jgi:hypothetical protein
MKHLFVVVLLFGPAFSGPGEAHHSTAATYHLGEIRTIEGTIVQVAMREPHAFVHVEVLDGRGILRRWSAEWKEMPDGSGADLARTAVRVGDHVRIIGHPARNRGVDRLLIVQIALAEDHQGGS